MTHNRGGIRELEPLSLLVHWYSAVDGCGGWLMRPKGGRRWPLFPRGDHLGGTPPKLLHHFLKRKFLGQGVEGGTDAFKVERANVGIAAFLREGRE